MTAGEFIPIIILAPLFFGSIYVIGRYYQENEAEIRSKGAWTTFSKAKGVTQFGLYFVAFMVLFGGMVSVMILTEGDGGSQKTEQKTYTNSEDTPPEGYKRGHDCNACLGSGKKAAHDTEIGYYGGVCASCNGKGYNWVKK